MIKRILIVTLVFAAMTPAVNIAFAAPVSPSGANTTIASLTAMLENQRAGLTKDQMMMVTKDQMTLLTEKMIIEKLIKMVMTKDQVIMMMEGIGADKTVMALTDEQSEMLKSARMMGDKGRMLKLLDKLMITLTKDQMMMMVDQMMTMMSKEQMMLMLDNMTMLDDNM
jgi:hypothetical protein